MEHPSRAKVEENELEEQQKLFFTQYNDQKKLRNDAIKFIEKKCYEYPIIVFQRKEDIDLMHGIEEISKGTGHKSYFVRDFKNSQ